MREGVRRSVREEARRCVMPGVESGGMTGAVSGMTGAVSDMTGAVSGMTGAVYLYGRRMHAKCLVMHACTLAVTVEDAYLSWGTPRHTRLLCMSPI